jgi:predicted ribonuclease toxin of YeeF-YezG toxin-antitoxin module
MRWWCKLIEAARMRAGRAGVTINAKLDKKQHLTNVKASAEEMASANLEHAFHGKGSNTIRPNYQNMKK